jgi:hypothetical protein
VTTPRICSDDSAGFDDALQIASARDGTDETRVYAPRMTTVNCSACGVGIAGAETLYTATGQPICQACNDKADVAKALNLPRAAMDVPNAVNQLVDAREFEFDGNDNAVIRSVASPMAFVGYISVIFGLLQIVLHLRTMSTLAGFLGIVEGVLLAVAGSWLIPAASSLRAIVDTEGSDITNLMYALKKLRNVYWLQAVLWGLACALILIVVLMTLSH